MYLERGVRVLSLLEGRVTLPPAGGLLPKMIVVPPEVGVRDGRSVGMIYRDGGFRGRWTDRSDTLSFFLFHSNSLVPSLTRTHSNHCSLTERVPRFRRAALAGRSRPHPGVWRSWRALGRGLIAGSPSPTNTQARTSA